MAGRKTAVPSVPAPPALGIAIAEYEAALSGRDELAEVVRQSRISEDAEIAALTQRIEAIQDQVAAANNQAINRLAEAETMVVAREGALKTEALHARQKTKESVFDHAGWTITTRKPNPMLVVTPPDNLLPLIGELEKKYPGELDAVLPRKVALAELKRLVNYCIAAERPLTYASVQAVTADGREVVVAIKPPEPKPEATPEHAETADAVAAASGTTWEDLTADE